MIKEEMTNKNSGTYFRDGDRSGWGRTGYKDSAAWQKKAGAVHPLPPSKKIVVECMFQHRIVFEWDILSLLDSGT